MKEVAVVIPKHTLYDPKDPYVCRGGGGPYGASYLQQMWGEQLHVTLVDDNLYGHPAAQYQQDALERADVIGFTLIGVPYLDDFENNIQGLQSQGKKVFAAGPGIVHFSPQEWNFMFRKLNTVPPRYTDEKAMSEMLDITYTQPVKENMTSLAMLQQLPDELLIEYFSREVCMYLADGCKYACHFCSVENRNEIGKEKSCSRERIGVIAEKYRNMHFFIEELERTLATIQRLNTEQPSLVQQTTGKRALDGLQIYFSNLDILQTPLKILDTADIIRTLSDQYNIPVRWRGLPTMESVISFEQQHPGKLQYLHACGLHALGPGPDGADVHVWKQVGKGHNKISMLYDVPQIIHDAGITPELLMVVGHTGIDNARTLNACKKYSQEMFEVFGAISRYHVAKTLPGSTGPRGRLSSYNAWSRHKLLHDVGHFGQLDFLARPNSISHPNIEERDLFNDKISEIEEMLDTFRYPEGVIPPAKTHIAVNPDKNFIQEISTRYISMGAYDH